MGMNVKLCTNARTCWNICAVPPKYYYQEFFFPFRAPFHGSCRCEGEGKGRAGCQGSRRGVRVMVCEMSTMMCRASRSLDRTRVLTLVLDSRRVFTDSEKLCGQARAGRLDRKDRRYAITSGQYGPGRRQNIGLCAMIA